MRSAITRRDLVRAGAVIAAGVAVRQASALAGQPRDRLARAMRRQASLAHAPSVSAAAISGGRVVWADAIGTADLERDVAATPRTIYNVASVSKLVTAVAVLQAWEEGIVDLDGDVNAVLPFEVHHPVRRRAPITPRQLLTHTSGIRDTWSTLSGLYVEGDSPISLRRFLRGYLEPGGAYFDRGSNFTDRAPGERFVYSNVGFALAGYVVEAASGVPFDARCRARIFEPLGMRNTSWHLRGLDRSRIARPYRFVYRSSTWRSAGLYGYPDYPDGLLRTTTRDLGRFLAAASNGGTRRDTRILETATVDQMLTDQLSALRAPWQGLGFYRARIPDGEPLVGHNGGDRGAFADAWFRPSDGSGVIVLANVSAWRATEYRALVDLRDRIVGAAHRL